MADNERFPVPAEWAERGLVRPRAAHSAGTGKRSLSDMVVSLSWRLHLAPEFGSDIWHQN